MLGRCLYSSLLNASAIGNILQIQLSGRGSKLGHVRILEEKRLGHTYQKEEDNRTCEG